MPKKNITPCDMNEVWSVVDIIHNDEEYKKSTLDQRTSGCPSSIRVGRRRRHEAMKWIPQ